ncbi:MAG TPA: histone deacetylase [Bryobacteraceae bacterium]|nr:histone deacetylase [Bryobacteraceae bacterium]
MALTRRQAIAAISTLAGKESALSAQNKKTALMADPISKEHQTGKSHPERPERFQVIWDALEHEGIVKRLTSVASRLATDDEIAACHTRRYIETAKRDIGSGARQLSTGDTAVSSRTLEVALKAAGGALNAVDAVITGKAKNAFCLVRPPGHHATPDRGMGFCVFNNVAVASRYAQRKHGLERVLIADWDVHHGNGTQDIFYSDGSVLFFSTHQHPWYPGTGSRDETGEGNGKGRILNRPFPAGAGREEILGAFRQSLMPVADAFKPDLVILSAGFDSRKDDPLGHFLLSDDDFSELTQLMLEIAEKHAQGRLVSVLEGGYNLNGIGPAVIAHVKALEKA